MGIDVHVMQIVVRILVLCSASVAVNRINSDGRWKNFELHFPDNLDAHVNDMPSKNRYTNY